MPMTARHVRLLCLSSSPFLVRSLKPEQLAKLPNIYADAMAFLWIVSPRFRNGHQASKVRFFKSIRSVTKKGVVDVCGEILAYVEEAYMDAPSGDNSLKSYYAFEISVVNVLHRNWGLPVDFWENHWLRKLIRRFTGKPCPLDVPLKIVWQNMKEQRAWENPGAIMSNASDKLLADGLALMNKRSKEEAAKHVN